MNMKSFADDTELFAAMRASLFTAVIGDILDTMGFLHQFLPPNIRALRDDMVAIGRAMPVLEADFFAAAEPSGQSRLSVEPFGLMFRALDSLKPHEIYVASGASPRYALWGELMSTRALHLKAAGAILDGYCRDSGGILALNFPTFCYGSYAQDQGPRGKVVDFAVPIEIGDVRIRPGDVLFADRDGVLVIPREAEKQAIALASKRLPPKTRCAWPSRPA